MKRIIVTVSALLIAGRLFAAGAAQQVNPAQPEAVAAAPDAAVVKAAAPVKKKAVKKAGSPAAPAVTKAAIAPAVSAAAEVKQSALPEIVPIVSAQAEAPEKPAVARIQACPGCFQPLLDGYNGIIADLKPWMDERDAMALDLDRRLSEIQKRINEKDDAIEQAKLGADKKAAKAAVKSLNKERKAILKEYTDTNDKKDGFYKTFSSEVEKKVEGYNKIAAVKLQMTLSAASQ